MECVARFDAYLRPAAFTCVTREFGSRFVTGAERCGVTVIHAFVVSSGKGFNLRLCWKSAVER